MKQAAIPAAAQSGSCDLVAKLLDAGADVNEKGNGGETALMLAASRGRLDLMTMLMEHGADIDAFTDAGNTALMFAAARGQIDAVRVLIERGARIDHRNKYGLGATDWAKWTEREAEIMALINAARPA